VTLPFQGTEVLLDNIAPLPGMPCCLKSWKLNFSSAHSSWISLLFASSLGEDRFSADANTALGEMTRGVPLLAQVSL